MAPGIGPRQRKQQIREKAVREDCDRKNCTSQTSKEAMQRNPVFCIRADDDDAQHEDGDPGKSQI